MQQGFTLLELIAVTSVLGLLSLIGVQSYSDYHDSQRLKLATTQVYSALISARSLAYAKRKDLWLKLEETQTNTVFTLADNTDGLNPLSYFAVEHISLQLTSESIHFDGYRGEVLGNGSITLSSETGQQLKVIYHQISGRIRVCSPERGSLGYAVC